LVSRRHARLILSDEAVLVEDLSSSNGTFVDGQPVIGAQQVESSQRIQIGEAVIALTRLAVQSGRGHLPRLLPGDGAGAGKYEIGEIVAQGGMGAILNARDGAIRRRVAMKVVLHDESEEGAMRFVEEAQITGQLEHPNIVPVHELALNEQGQPYYTMKFVRGITLKKILELLANGISETVAKYPLAALLTVFQKVCDAVAFAHSKSVIHRDLKPENIIARLFCALALNRAQDNGPPCPPRFSKLTTTARRSCSTSRLSCPPTRFSW